MWMHFYISSNSSVVLILVINFTYLPYSISGWETTTFLYETNVIHIIFYYHRLMQKIIITTNNCCIYD